VPAAETLKLLDAAERFADRTLIDSCVQIEAVARVMASGRADRAHEINITPTDLADRAVRGHPGPP
jgi:hypothetical protein